MCGDACHPILSIAVTHIVNRLLVAGGTNGASSALGSGELLETITGTWSAVGSMGDPRRLHAAMLLADGRVMFSGGWARSWSSPVVDVYDPNEPGQPAAQPVLLAQGICATDFYIAETAMPKGSAEGYWGMEVLLTRGARQLLGGFNLGGGFDGNARNPGFGAFGLSTTQRVTVTVNAQPLADPIGLDVSLLKDNTTRVGGVQGTPTATAPLTFAADLDAGFYVVRIGSVAGSGRGTFQLGLATAGAFANGVVVGGFLSRNAAGASLTGFGAFCVPQTQPVRVRTFGVSQYGTNAVGALTRTLRDAQRNVIGSFP